MATKRPLVVAMAELIYVLDLSRRRVATLVSGVDFPEPVQTLTSGRVWGYEDVEAWAQRTGRTLRALPDVWPQAKD